jgi:hypothetical protein
MGQRRKPGATRESAAEQEMRDQEVLRANRELAAYFKGRRTEREARAALKIIKAFVRDRERRDARSRPPLPGADVAKAPKEVTNRKTASVSAERPRRKPRRKPRDKTPKSLTASIEPQADPGSLPSSESDERAPEEFDTPARDPAMRRQREGA